MTVRAFPDQTFDSVFIIEPGEDGQLIVQRRQVKTGAVRDGRAEIVEGLEAGEQVVSVGQMKLRNGQHVKIHNPVQLQPGPVTAPCGRRFAESAFSTQSP